MPRTDTDPSYERVVVRPGDFGRRFRVLDGFNRGINPAYARSLSRETDSIGRHGILCLYQKPDGSYLILDGQHRIYGVSEFSETPAAFEAQIWKSKDISPQELQQQVMRLNLGRAFRLSDHLSNTRNLSGWPAIFAAKGVYPSFDSSKIRLCWNSLVRARIAADEALSSKDVPVSCPRLDKLLEVWKTSDDARIEQTADVVVWWEKAAEPARKMRVPTLRSYCGLAFALVLYESNLTVADLDEVPKRLLDWPDLNSVVGLPHGRVRELWTALLRGINWKRRKNLLTVPGL